MLYAQKGSSKAAYSVAQNELSARHIAEEKFLLESLKQRQQAESNALQQAWSQELAVERPLDKEYDEAKDIRFEQWRVDDQEEKINRWGWRNSSAGTAMADIVQAYDQRKQELKQRKQAFEQRKQKNFLTRVSPPTFKCRRAIWFYFKTHQLRKPMFQLFMQKTFLMFFAYNTYILKNYHNDVF